MDGASIDSMNREGTTERKHAAGIDGESTTFRRLADDFCTAT
jgi:hypothetical protein